MKRKRQRNEGQDFADPEEAGAPPVAKKKRRSSRQDARSTEINGKVSATSDSWKLESACKTAGRKMRRISSCVRSPVHSSCKILAFREWCGEVGIKLHPEVSLLFSSRIHNCTVLLKLSSFSSCPPCLIPPMISCPLVAVVRVLTLEWLPLETSERGRRWRTYPELRCSTPRTAASTSTSKSSVTESFICSCLR